MYDKIYLEENRDKINSKQSKRRASKLNATVKWANHEKIKNIYAECALKTKETGIKHHVDHIIPLVSKFVCGLHCENNLQIITALENLTKNNSFSYD